MARWLQLVCLVGCGGSAEHMCPPTTVFLDRDGGHYEPAADDDPAINGSVIVDQARDLPGWPSAAASWDAVTSCIRDALAPVGAEVTEVDPGATPHYEIVFTTSYWAGSGGETSVVPSNCGHAHRIAFVFGDALPTAPRACQIALIALGEMAADLSLDDNCADFLNPAIDCVPDRFFVDGAANCVDISDQPTACRCGGTTQNTFQAMTAAFAPCGSQN
jgi:hypothetical protein